MRLRLMLVGAACLHGLCAVGCGGRATPAGSPGASAADAGPPGAVHGGAASSGETLAFPSATVPMSPMPPPFQFGSRKAERKPVPGLAGCHATFRPASANFAGEVQKLGKLCSEKSKTRPAGTPWTGSQTQNTGSQSFKFKAEAGRCYRAYAAAASTVTSLTLLVVDSTGAVAWESRSDDPSLAAPEDGVLCFKAADDAVVTVSVGGGEGAYAVQLWSD